MNYKKFLQQEKKKGKLEATYSRGKTSITDCFFSYPLRFVVPKSYHPCVDVYALNYGGGLVDGDRIPIEIHVKPNAALRLLTQSSTKVYKTRAATTANSIPTAGVASTNSNYDNYNSSKITTNGTGAHQSLLAHVAAHGTLKVEPEPVTCFAKSRYIQTQEFHLENYTSSLLVVDWITSGRISRDESWQMSLLSSVNDIYVDDTCILRDRWCIDQLSALALYQYTNIANVILVGSQFRNLVSFLLNDKGHTPFDGILWTVSPLHKPYAAHHEQSSSPVGCIVRAAANTTEQMRAFLNWVKDSCLFTSFIITNTAIASSGGSHGNNDHLNVSNATHITSSNSNNTFSQNNKSSPKINHQKRITTPGISANHSSSRINSDYNSAYTNSPTISINKKAGHLVSSKILDLSISTAVANDLVSPLSPSLSTYSIPHPSSSVLTTPLLSTSSPKTNNIFDTMDHEKIIKTTTLC